jgi:hypothetical protein
MRKVTYGIGCLIVLSLISNNVFSQVTITGPVCVTNNIVYLYSINGNFDSSHTWKTCVTGGKIDGTDLSCAEGRWDLYIKISWNIGSSGSIQLTSDSGNASLQVGITTQLSGGIIDSSVLIQVIDSLTTPRTILCSSAGGGSCTPSYIYKWQRSADNMLWIDIANTTSQNLAFSTPIRQSGYYRRKAKTQGSDAVAYTLAAAVFIKPAESR